MKTLAIARICHEANRGLQIEQADPSVPVSPSWDDLDVETQESIIQGVEGVLEGNTPEQSHAGWIEFKLVNGWSYGPVKDLELKQHPCLVPYGELPASQRLKDHLFSAIVLILGDDAAITSDEPPLLAPEADNVDVSTTPPTCTVCGELATLQVTDTSRSSLSLDMPAAEPRCTAHGQLAHPGP